MSIISDAFRALFSTKQKEGEGLQDYTRRFKTARDILESHLGGPICMMKYVESMKKLNLLGSTATDEDYYNKSSEQLLAYVYLENSNQDKYGSLLKNLNQQKSLENDQYPKTVASANSALSLHPFDNFKLHNLKASVIVVASQGIGRPIAVIKTRNQRKNGRSTKLSSLKPKSQMHEQVPATPP